MNTTQKLLITTLMVAATGNPVLAEDVSAGASAPLAASAPEFAIGYHGGSSRLDDGYYGDWVDKWFSSGVDPRVRFTEAVCGGATGVVGGVAVDDDGYWNNAVLCSGAKSVSTAAHSYYAERVYGEAWWVSPVHGYRTDWAASLDCGERGAVIGMAQNSNDDVFLGAGGSVALCGELADGAAAHDCRFLDLNSNGDTVPVTTSEGSTADWSPGYAKATCGEGRYVRGFVETVTGTASSLVRASRFGRAVMGVYCCSAD